MRSLPPLGLYVHLPWCIARCPYCDFNSYERRGELPERGYVDALLLDLEADLELAASRPVETIFIGGGTPSLFSGAAIAQLLDGIRLRIATTADCEITLEANPGAAEAQHFEDYRRAGVNRLSIGVQSLRDEQLGALGRVHSAAEAMAAIESARAAGFTNINLDLMYGLPGDDPAGACGDLEQAVGLAPTHVSWYQLTIEPQTHFERHPPALPDEDTVLAIEQTGRALLAQAGFERYEISAYAQPGLRCRHNLNYWQFGDYLGIGAGAHGKLTLADGHAIERRMKSRNPRTYMATAGTGDVVTRERIEARDTLGMEFLMNALRLVDGCAEALLVNRTGLTSQDLAGLDAARRRGWLTEEAGRLRATEAGLQSLNRLLALL